MQWAWNAVQVSGPSQRQPGNEEVRHVFERAQSSELVRSAWRGFRVHLHGGYEASFLLLNADDSALLNGSFKQKISTPDWGLDLNSEKRKAMQVGSL